MIVADKGEGGPICDALRDRLEGLMLLHVFFHLGTSPRRIIGDFGPVIVILQRASHIPWRWVNIGTVVMLIVLAQLARKWLGNMT